MNESSEMPEIDPQIPPHAVSVFGQNDAMDDFPVLKAFQQYIDAEQAKSRKRVIMLCVFFICLMAVVIGVFVALIFNVTARNQALNDRLVEYAMRKEQPSAAAPVVVQPPQDSAALLALTEKLDTLQKKFAEDQAKAEKAVKAAEDRAKQAEAEAAKPKGPTKEEVEIKRLKALLAAEKEKADAVAAAEKERLRQAEIEAYRRKHYPELYEQPKKPVKTATRKKTAAKAPSVRQRLEKIKAQVDDELEALSYFDEDEDEVEETSAKPQKEYSIPVEIKGSSTSWKIPND